MIKAGIILFNFIGLLIFGFYGDDGVTVDHKVPSQIHVGEKIPVSVEINKMQVTGFAKLDVKIPAGFIASAGETKGASFTFSTQQAKFIWFELPAEEVFTVTYFLEPLTGTFGKFDVAGTFSWVKSAQRVDFTMAVKSVEVVSGDAPAPIVSTPATEVTPTTESIAEPIVTASTPESTTVTPSSLFDNMQNEVVCTRTVEMISPTEAQVNLVVAVDNIQGFVKVFEVAPKGCTTVRAEDDGAVVTPDKNTIKFFWFEVPQSPKIELSYRINCTTDLGQAPNIIGKVSYIYNNEPVEREVIGAGSTSLSPVVSVSPGNNTSNNTAQNNTTTEPKVEPKAEPKSEPKVTPKTDPVVQNNPKSTTSVPEPENGITYKVQILAGHRVVNKQYFASKHQYSENFGIENHEGWVKYTTGKFGEYKKARDERERLKSSYNSLPGPFVTAYNNGERITVQEALLISKQQWYQ